MIRLALYEPDMPQNVGAAMRLCACLGAPLDLIEPCGFVWDEKRVRRVAMDYIDHVELTRHAGWASFQASGPGRLVLLTTRGAMPYTAFRFAAGDVLLLGRESAGVPDHVHAAVSARLFVPMRPGLRSLNVAMAGAIVLGEALRQIGQ